MSYLFYAIKRFFYNFFVVLLNGYYFIRFYFKAKCGYFNKDFYNYPIKDEWNITFQDEFENNEINFDTPGGWNKWFSKNTMASPDEVPTQNSLDCIEQKNGKLYLFTKKNEDYPYKSPYPLKTGLLHSAYHEYYDYKTGKMTYKGHKQQYGYFETSCKVPPNGLTFWPAFWLYGETWPPEIDIFEFMDKKDINSGHSKGISMTLHWGNPGKKDMKGKSTQIGRKLRNFLFSSVNFDEHFHIYAIKWEWDYVEWYIDNIPVYRSVYNIPNNKMSILINNGAKKDMLPNDDQMPQEFIINYVRAYQKK